MPNINITVKNKIAVGDGTKIICNNSDYVVKFAFDSEWDNHDIKTLRVKYGNGYSEVVFTGDTVTLPAISNTISAEIGVYAGDIETSTPAFFDCQKSILCGSGTHIEPPKDVYNQLVDLVESGAVKGEKGDKGDKGEKGDTPVKGVDYYTEADKQEIKDDVLDDLGQVSVSEKWRLIRDDTLTEGIKQYEVTTDTENNTISLKKLMVEVYADTTEGVYSTGNIMFNLCRGNNEQHWSRVLWSTAPFPTTEGKCSYVLFTAEAVGTNVIATTSMQKNVDGFAYNQLGGATNVIRAQAFPLNEETIKMVRLNYSADIHIGTRIVVWGVDA